MQRLLSVVSGLAIVAGLSLMFIFDGDSGWFTYAPLAEGESFSVTGGTIISNQEIAGFALIAAAAATATGLWGYRLGSRRGR